MKKDSSLTLDGERYHSTTYANVKELTEQRTRDLELGFTSLDCLVDKVLVLEGEEEVRINSYSTLVSSPEFCDPCTLKSYLIPRLLFDRLQGGLEKQFLHREVSVSRVLTLSCQTLIQEILAAKDHLNDSDYIVDQLEKLTLHISSWLGWMEVARFHIDLAHLTKDCEKGIDAIMHRIIEEERVIEASSEDVLDSDLSTVLHLPNCTLSYICRELQACVDYLLLPFSASSPKRNLLSTKALAARQRSQEEILKPLQQLRLELKKTVEAAIWIGSSPKHLSFLVALPLFNIFSVKEKNNRALLIKSMEMLDTMQAVRAKMRMGRVRKGDILMAYIHAFREETESLSIPRSLLKKEKEAPFPKMLSLGFTLEGNYQHLVSSQRQGLKSYLRRIESTAAASFELDPYNSANLLDFNTEPLTHCRLALLAQGLSLCQMNEARKFNEMQLTAAMDSTTIISRGHSTLGSMGWLEMWKLIQVHEIPVSPALSPSVSSFLQSTNALLRQIPAIPGSRIDYQLKFLYAAHPLLLNYEYEGFTLIYDYLANFGEIEALYLWTCAMSRHCILLVNTIKKNEKISYEEIDQLIFLIESHRLLGPLKISERLVDCYRSFIPRIVAPTYMADALIEILMELRETRRCKLPEVLAEESPTLSAAAESPGETYEVAPDRVIVNTIPPTVAQADAAEESLDPVIIEALADIMNGTGFYAEPAPIRLEGRAGAGTEQLIPDEPSLISDMQLKSIKDHRHLHHFLRAAGMQCLRQNGGSHSTWGAAGVKFTVACHPKQEISPKIRQRIMNAVKSAHEAMEREALGQSLKGVATKKVHRFGKK